MGEEASFAALRLVLFLRFPPQATEEAVDKGALEQLHKCSLSPPRRPARRPVVRRLRMRPEPCRVLHVAASAPHPYDPQPSIAIVVRGIPPCCSSLDPK